MNIIGNRAYISAAQKRESGLPSPIVLNEATFDLWHQTYHNCQVLTDHIAADETDGFERDETEAMRQALGLQERREKLLRRAVASMGPLLINRLERATYEAAVLNDE